jgi:hypothetical protein
MAPTTFCQVVFDTISALLHFAVGVNIFYICLAIYLYGDLAIYAAAVPKSLRDVAW